MTLIPRTLTALLAAGAMLAAAGAARADYPDHPINMVVPFAAGGPDGQRQRALLALEAMRPTLGQTVVVEKTRAAPAARSARPRVSARSSPTAIPSC